MHLKLGSERMMNHRTTILSGIRTFGSTLTLLGNRILTALRRRIAWLRWFRKASRIWWTVQRLPYADEEGFRVGIMIPEGDQPLFGPGELGEEDP